MVIKSTISFWNQLHPSHNTILKHTWAVLRRIKDAVKVKYLLAMQRCIPDVDVLDLSYKIIIGLISKLGSESETTVFVFPFPISRWCQENDGIHYRYVRYGRVTTTVLHINSNITYKNLTQIWIVVQFIFCEGSSLFRLWNSYVNLDFIA